MRWQFCTDCHRFPQSLNHPSPRISSIESIRICCTTTLHSRLYYYIYLSHVVMTTFETRQASRNGIRLTPLPCEKARFGCRLLCTIQHLKDTGISKEFFIFNLSTSMAFGKHTILESAHCHRYQAGSCAGRWMPHWYLWYYRRQQWLLASLEMVLRWMRQIEQRQEESVQ